MSVCVCVCVLQERFVGGALLLDTELQNQVERALAAMETELDYTFKDGI